MKRWVWLGVLGGVMACTKVPGNKPVEPENVCPGTEEYSLSSPLQSQKAQPQEEEGTEAVLITYRPRAAVSAKARAEAFADEATRLGAEVKHRFASINTVAARVTPETRAALARNPDVLRVEPDRPVHAFSLPSSVLPSLVSGVAPNTSGSTGEYTQGLRQVQAPLVWDSNNDGVLDTNAPSGSNVTVCLIDSGWDNRHPELAAAYAGGKDFIDNDEEPLDQGKVDGVLVWGGGHGTHTAATIAAQLGAGAHVRPGEEPNGVVGVAPTVKLLIARVLNANGDGSTSAVIAAMDWCISQGANIASLSLGSSERSDAEELVFNRAHAAGMVSIAATGNRGTPNPSYPAAYSTVIGVGAVDFNGARASFSQYGPFVKLVGPGVGVLSATIMGGAPYADIQSAGNRYPSEPLEYTAVGAYTGKLVHCGQGERVASCGEGATCEGFVALVDRGGGILFQEKALNAIRAGAKAIIIGNNITEDGTGNFTLTDPADYWVPTTSVTLSSANTFRGMVGQQVTVDVTGLDYMRQSGTSMATPHVAGVAALVWSACRALTHEQVTAVLLDSAQDLGDRGRDDLYGHGLVQAKRAVDLALQRCPPPAPAP
ncbi:S8A family peptidase [Myxococcus stipitatus DSM 14675]|uniref:S8A family peptidase n=1 Tax=Myxococcus stipitatus (strain DSM 14675 / JCM 12634 / Mx s8) TaxID=1278073 RepID=L7UML6_MYXSD|nr:S8 family serine peptidase [Myxococcus stipitatus]AGC49253.1 S8A family peptidase [Myxococcus stipitatus DSM 14675]